MKILVILGNKLREDGTLSPAGEKRVLEGAKLASYWKPDRILLSGGKTGCEISEAKAMQQLLSANVEDCEIVLEDKSKTTVENGKYISEILQKEGEKCEVVVLSSKEHISRKFHNPIDIFDKIEKKKPNISIKYFGV